MADCNETLRELEPFIDGEISDEAREHIHGHLGACVDCQQAFEFHLELREAVRRKASNDELPASLVAKLEVCLRDDFDGDGVVGSGGSDDSASVR
ncbi:MAG: zf-HC2 domain-containing protein [Ilumatobacteraceae bacterium]|jgi:mycothiol system anti-sigma-R factor|nr:zf-HC2 domain-containing protein [Ilumatobacteraceae bacterium]